jgi:hypothetical protein
MKFSKQEAAMKDTHINTDAKIENDAGKRMPHERDESPDGQAPKPRSIMKQAAADIDSGMVDTDLREQRGVQKPKPPEQGDAKAQPQPNVKRD